MLHFTRPCLSALGLALALTLAPATAATVETRFGALDGLGIGLVSGDAFELDDLVNPQPDGTNDWAFGGLAQAGAGASPALPCRFSREAGAWTAMRAST
jgi:hypothetical protein